MTVNGKVFNIDTFEAVKLLEDNILSAVITDPPYFLDGMGDSWQADMVERKTTKSQTVQSLRSGMKFNKQQGVEFQNYMNRLAVLLYPKLKPGGFFVAFSAPRLYHRLAVGVEDAGYEIRDMWQWLYTQNQMKAMGLTRGLDKFSESIPPEQYEQLEKELQVWKTPQVKSCFEPIVLAQKLREGTFLNNWVKHHTGLVNVKIGVGLENNKDTSNVMTTENISELLDNTFLVGKPTKTEKGGTNHLSVKPLTLMRHLCNVLVPAGGLILDPFNGSGSTGIAALLEGRNFIGFEKNVNYFNQSAKRNEEHFTVKFNSDKTVFTVE